MEDSPLTKVAFTDEQGHVETLWAFDLGGGRYKLDNTPWYQYGVSYQDIVAASPRPEGGLHFDRIISKSGFRTLRVLSEEPVPQDILAQLVQVGCKYEGANRSFFAIDVPPGIELSRATEVLIASGLQWEYSDPTHEDLYGAEA